MKSFSFIKRLSFFSFVVLLVNTELFSQIDSVKVFPPNPSSTDTVKLVAYTTFPTGGCVMLGSVVTKPTRDSIVVEACHDDMNHSFTCISIDTITLGVFLSGSYKIQYILHRYPVNGSDSAYCTVKGIDSAGVNFTVTGLSGVDKSELRKHEIRLFPNPSSGNVSIDFHFYKINEKPELVFFDVAGKEVKRILIDLQVKEINIHDLSRGIYLYRLETTSFKGEIQKFLKN